MYGRNPRLPFQVEIKKKDENVDEVAKSIDCEEESKYVVKITVYIQGVKDTVAERLEAHEFCSTARRVSCWFESHQQQSTFFLFFLFLFFSFQFFESSFFTLHLFSFFPIQLYLKKPEISTESLSIRSWGRGEMW